MSEQEPKNAEQEQMEPQANTTAEVVEETETQPTTENEQEAEKLEKEQEPLDELETLRQQWAELQTKADEYLDGWQRSRAELINFRRRQEKLQENIRQQANARLMTNLLPVLDDLERAFESVPEKVNEHPWVKGLSLVHNKVCNVLKKEGLSEMEVQPGDEFDPTYHQAILHEPSTEFDKGQIVQVFNKGYKLKDVILRPAIVQVSSGQPDPEEEKD